jgi:hypothetical protein
VKRAGGTAVEGVRRLAVGDRIAIAGPGHTRNSRDRTGTVVAILGPHGREVYRVRWTDGGETMFRPGEDVVVTGHGERERGGGDAAG